MEISMTLEPHGWLEMLITSKEGHEIEIPVSFLTDAIYDLAQQVSLLNNEVGEVIITMQTEPGEYRFRISQLSNTYSLFELFEMDDNFSTQFIEEGTLLLAEEIKTIALFRIIHRELSKMKTLGAEEFKERWGSDFPTGQYERIADSMNRWERNEMKTIIPKGCDNAPRKQIVIDFTIAILQQQTEIVKEYADESVIWHQLKDHKKVEGRSALMDLLQDEDKEAIDCLAIDQVITHGKFASINGVILLTNGIKIDFCDVYTFSNTAKSGKVKEIKSYRLTP